jgi:hypothetical protein
VSESRITNRVEVDMILVMSIISLRRLMDGGAAIFLAVDRNHHKVRVGAVIKIPFVRSKFRVFMIS